MQRRAKTDFQFTRCSDGNTNNDGVEFEKSEGVSKAIVGRWIKAGLPVLTDSRIESAAGRAWLKANIHRRTEQTDGEAFADAKARKDRRSHQ
jgi:hypothetical protein